MRYVSVNRPTDFEFHDAKFMLESFDNTHLKVRASYVNVHKDAEQNPFETDMEIDKAYITFDGFDLISYEPSRESKQGEDGEYYFVGDRVILTEKNAYIQFEKMLKNGFTVYDFGLYNDSTYFIDALSNDPFFTVLFKFDKFTVEWDEYKGKAWYASKKQH